MVWFVVSFVFRNQTRPDHVFFFKRSVSSGSPPEEKIPFPLKVNQPVRQHAPGDQKVLPPRGAAVWIGGSDSHCAERLSRESWRQNGALRWVFAPGALRNGRRWSSERTSSHPRCGLRWSIRCFSHGSDPLARNRSCQVSRVNSCRRLRGAARGRSEAFPHHEPRRRHH